MKKYFGLIILIGLLFFVPQITRADAQNIGLYGNKPQTPQADHQNGVASTAPATASIGDFVWHDLYHSQSHEVDGIQDVGEPGIVGVTVELYDSNDTKIDTTTTDANGHYIFDNLTAGSYTVKIADSNFSSGGVLEGWYGSPVHKGSNDSKDCDGNESSHTATVTLTSGETNNDVDFGFYHTGIDLQKSGPQSVAAGGTITYHFRVENTGDLVLHGGAHVYDPLINPHGNHEIWESTVWPGEVYEFDKTYTTNPNQCGTLTNNATAVGHPRKANGNYVDDVTDHSSWTTQVLCYGSIGDRVWDDVDGNGIQNNGELGISGVTVAIYSGATCSGTALSTTTTDGNGNYLFDHLATPGTYSVKFTKPAGYTFSPQNAGGDDTKDSDADTSTGCTGGITLSAKQNDMTWDAGMHSPCLESVALDATHTDWVDSEDPNKSHHDKNTLHVRAKTNGYVRRTYYYFDLSTLPSGAVVSAQLAIDPKGGEPGTMGLHATNWDGTSIKWTTAPAVGSLVDSEYYDGGKDTQFFDVISALAGHPSNASLVLKFTDEHPNAKEHDDHQNPRLLLTVNVCADLGITKSDNPDPVVAGGVLTYTLAVTNNGPADAQNVVVTDSVPSELQSLEYSTDGGNSWGAWGGSTALGNMNAGDSKNVLIRGTVNPAVTVDSITNTAVVGSDTPDSDTSNNSDTEDTTIYRLASLGDYVWEDTNADGIQDSGESGIQGVTVELYNGTDCASPAVMTTTTNSSGVYNFTDLTPGTYSIKFVKPAGYTFSPANQGSDDAVDSDANASTGCTGGITLTAGQNDMTWDTGMYQAPSVAVDKNVPQQNNVLNGIVLVGNTVNFQVVVTNTGSTTLAYIPLHDQFDNTCLRYAPKSANPQENDHSSDSIDWVDLTLTFGHDLQPGQAFTITIPFQTAAEDDHAVNTAQAHDAKDVNNAIVPTVSDQASVICKLPASIGDRVWNDSNNNGTQDSGEPGINNVTVRLYKDDGDGVFEPGGDDTLVATQVTSGDGDYDFTMLYAGSYWVDVDESTLASGYELTTGNEPLLVNVNYGDDYNDADFGYAGRGDIAGTVWYDWNSDGTQQPNEDGIPNVEVCLYKDNNGDGQLDSGDTKLTCQNTDSSGNYIFHDQLPGNYLVVETQPSGMDDTTPNVVAIQLIVSGPSGSDVDNNFGDIQYASVGDFVYADSNGNGVQDTSETQGIPGATLHLTGTDVNGDSVDRSTTSDANGNYSFDQLLPGDYQVQATPPAGYTVTSTNPQSFHLNAGDAKDDVDFGLLAPTAVQIIALQAQAAGREVTVTWQTAAEEDVDRFVVQRHAKDGWLKVGEVPAVGMGSNSYRFTEQNVPIGRQLYRIVSLPNRVAYGPVEVTITDPGRGGGSYRVFLPFANR